VTLSVAVAQVESVVGSESPEVAVSEQHSESDSVAATSEGRLQVKREGCQWVEVVLCERQLAPILALAQFGEETRCRGNSCVPVLWRQQQHQVGKVGGELGRSSRSPPLYRFSYFQFFVHDSVEDDEVSFLLSQNSETDD
jgi:hypothetical protein